MSDEAAFLAAIASDPATRLVYADWLEDRSDPRAELIRIEEEMGNLPVFADRYWELKPRRNQLRAASPSEWLQTMRYGTDTQPVFRHGWPEGWRERWRLIREFVDRWHQIPLPDVGGRQDKIREAEKRLKRKLPPAMREWIAFAYDVGGEEHPCVLRDPYTMEELKGHKAISLIIQAEGDSHWAIRHADLKRDDPPINTYYGNDEDKRWVRSGRKPTHDTLTSFVLGYSLGYTQGQGGGFAKHVASPGPLENLKNTFPVHCRIDNLDIFEMDNIQVHLSGAEQRYMRVTVSRPTPREAVPAFLWQYAQGGGWYAGMFTPPEFAEQENLRPEPEVDPHADDIPF
jgi:uncharacterized protein (TIGR02996 family)